MDVKQEFHGRPLPTEVVLMAQLRIFDLQGEHLRSAGTYLPRGTSITATAVQRFGDDSCQDQYSGVLVRWGGGDYWVLLTDLERCVGARQFAH